MLKVWVTGSRGFVGSALMSRLKQSGFDAVGITNTQSVSSDTIFVDYGNRKSIQSVLDQTGVPDILFHLGWGRVYEPESDLHLGENLENTKTFLDVLYQHGLKKALLIGSSSEYGSREGSLLESDSPIGRLTNYARGKIEACHQGFKLAEQYGKIFIHVRLYHTLGAGHRKSSLIHQLYQSYQSSTPLSLSDCEQFRDYIYLSDAAEGMIQISSINSSEIVNLGSGNKIQLKELIKMFWSQLGGRHPDLLKFNAHQRPANEPVQPPCYANMEKLKKLTGWQPSFSLEEGVAQTIQALKVQFS